MADAETIIDVNPVELTDEQLDAELSGNAVEKAEEVQSEATDENKSTETEEETKEAEAEQKEVEETQEVKEEDKYVKITKEEWENTQKRIEEKEKFIQRQAAEVGKRRKSEEQIRSELLTLQTQLQERWNEPLEATQIQGAIREREKQLNEAELHTITEFNRNTVKTFVPEHESLIDDMIELVKEDGQPEEAIRAFRDNPYKEPPGTLINLAKRAEQRRELRNKDAKIASLEAELVALKKEPKEVLKKIEKTLREPSQMSNNSGQASSTKQGFEETQIPHMTDAELDRLLKESS
ncbi:MAG: hypothetical protein PHD64_11405 [Mesotoga sp.]|jgi:DNA repair exonuclease SbcCD ATPase subunit|nr:hypothetical protein [Mesotoga sp.]